MFSSNKIKENKISNNYFCPFCFSTLLGSAWGNHGKNKQEGCQIVCRKCYARGPIGKTEKEAKELFTKRQT